MLNFVVGFILGIVVATSGFTFTDAASYMDKGVNYVKEASQQPEVDKSK